MSPGHGDLARVGLGVGNGSGTDVLNLNHDINMTITNLSLHCLATFVSSIRVMLSCISKCDE